MAKKVLHTRKKYRRRRRPVIILTSIVLVAACLIVVAVSLFTAVLALREAKVSGRAIRRRYRISSSTPSSTTEEPAVNSSKRELRRKLGSSRFFCGAFL